ncbi:hypothetical protein ACKWTF_009974 [Chironomus riparius]
MFFKIINKLFFVQMITFIQCGFLKVSPDEAVYETINAMLKNQISNDTKLYECIVAHFEKNDIADNLPTFYDQNKLSTVIQPYIDEAKSSLQEGFLHRFETLRKIFALVKRIFHCFYN